MDTAALKRAIRKELPDLLREDPSLREYVLSLTEQIYANKQYTEDRFWEVLSEIRRDREEQSRKWAEAKAESEQRWTEAKAESERKWEEQKQKWEENQKVINEMLAEIKKQDIKHDRTLGALGARWGLYSEESFRNGLKAILEESFGVKVLNVKEYDDSGEVFGRPDQVELDLIIYNGMLILCEIKSSISRAELHIFERKTIYYEKHHNRKVTRKMVISPMVEPRALELAKELGIEVYSHSYDVKSVSVW